MRIGRLVVACLVFGMGSADASDRVPIPEPDVSAFETVVADQITEMVDTLRRVLEQSSGSDVERAAAYGELGRVFQAYGLLESATAAYLNASALEPASYDWQHYLGLAHREAGDLPGAIRHFGAALTIRPGRVPPLIYLGEAFLELNRIEESERAFEEALGGAPGSAAALAGLGQVALSRRRYDRAAELFEAALEAQPEATRLHYPLALAYRGLGEEERARDEMTRSGEVGVAPADPLRDQVVQRAVGERVFLLRGRMAFAAGRYEEAALAFGKAVEAEPTSVRALVNHAAVLHALGDRPAAREELRRALELSPESPTAHFNLATVLAADGDHAAALDHFDAAMLSNPNDEGSWLGKARSLVDLERYVEALAVLEDAHQKLPTSGQVAFGLSTMLSQCPDLGLRDGRRALDLAEVVFRARAAIGHVALVASALAELDRCEDAATWQSKAVEAARTAGDEAVTTRLEAVLARYQSGSPCRAPSD